MSFWKCANRKEAIAAKRRDNLTAADVVVLAMLAARPTHGYDIVVELNRQESGGGSPVSRAQIYYSLKKLLTLGFVAVVKDGVPAAGPEREPYRLTPAGKRAMSAAIAKPEWAQERPPIPFHSWLAVLGEAEQKDRATAIGLRRDHLRSRIERESKEIARLRGTQDAMRLAVVMHEVEVLKLELQLLTDVEPMLGRD